jgi:hypothetical protein
MNAQTKPLFFRALTRPGKSVPIVLVAFSIPIVYAQQTQSVTLNPEQVASARAQYAKAISAKQCEPAQYDYPRWEGYPVQLCNYVEKSKIDPVRSVFAKPYLLLPTADMLARWTVTACADAGSTDAAKCIEVLVTTATRAASGNIFPVAGYVPESKGSSGGVGNEIVCIPFRDGVTAYSKKIPRAVDPRDNKCAMDDVNEQPIVQAMRFARVVSTTRLEYKQNGGNEIVGSDNDRDPRWIDVVRGLFQRAWTSDRNELISAKARALRANGKFK